MIIIKTKGECGLDYDRTFFCDIELQKIGFTHQIGLAKKYNLPMFLHNRNTNGDFLSIISKEINR
jgi:TatD DNase family protein